MIINNAVSSQRFPTAIHQQNVDLFALVLRCVARGDRHTLNSAGLTERDVAHLGGLNFAQLMELSNRGLKLSAYLGQARARLEQEGLCEALIEQRAPRELIMQLFGTSTRRYAAERMRLGIAGGRGRPSTSLTDSSIEHRIWRLWVILADDLEPRRLRQADHWLLISQEVPGHLRTAWALIQRWAKEKESMAAFKGDRNRMNPDCRGNAERQLRTQHRAAMEPRLFSSSAAAKAIS